MFRRKTAVKVLKKKECVPGRLALLPKPFHQEPPEEESFFLDRLFYETDNEDESEEEPDESPQTPPTVEKPKEPEVPLDPLAVEVNLCKVDNKKDHNTSDFCRTIFAVRRGQAFSIKVDVNKEFNKEQDHLVVTFMIGDNPKPSKETLIRIPVEIEKPAKDAPYEWSAHMLKVTPTTGGSSQIDVEITPAADCPVGNYTLKVTYYRKHGKKERRTSKIVEDVYILFNAWCKDDQVYLDSKDERDEYVLNQTGKIYTGSSGRIGNRNWVFGQFSKAALKAAVFLLNESTLDVRAHGNATNVTRTLSAMVNANDDDGVLCGNWSGNYEGGTSPVMWSGSIAILEEFLAKETGVMYGQCWVFSGLITTLGRSLGIPTRSVTNFDSAHDTDGSLTIDRRLMPDGTYIRDDSVWNFHVWNESWFQRPDLPDGYDGWQAYDATPQESSDGKMQCGPASLRCIKEGDLYLSHDATFIFAEVNGSNVTWEQGHRSNKIISMTDDHVGKCISTKAVLSQDREDVTDLYKYKEGTSEEKKARARAYKYSCQEKAAALRAYMAETIPTGVNFEYKSCEEKNGDIMLEVKATNTADLPMKFPLKCTFHGVTYTGMKTTDLPSYIEGVCLNPGQNQKWEWSLKGKDYMNKIDDDGMLLASVTAKVKGTGQFFNKEETFTLDKPDLTMEVSKKNPKVGEEITVTVSFENQLDVELTQGYFIIEGPGILKADKVTLNKTVPANGKFSHTVKLKPKYIGPREIVAACNFRQLTNISGSVDITVVE